MNKKIDELNNLIEKIKNSNTLIIVEGKKDKIALQKLGLTNIMELNKKPNRSHPVSSAFVENGIPATASWFNSTGRSAPISGQHPTASAG